MAHSALVEARGWGARYRGRRSWAIRSLDLRIEEGERVLLVGPSGGGKSTLLHGIAGLHGRAVPIESEGSLLVGGRDASHGGDTGILFQDPESQIVMARCGDEVAFGLEERCVPAAEIWPRVHEALAAVAFPYPGDHPTAALSGGEKQRLALAAVLALRPRVLLLDEPTSSLDPDGARDLYAALGSLPRSTTVVLVEHHVDLAQSVVDRVVAIDGERGVVADGDAATVLRERGTLQRLGVWIPGERFTDDPPRPGAELVAARDVSFLYPGAHRDALLPTDATLREGEALSLVGPNGSGKSTLLLLLGGLVRPQRGTIGAARLDARTPEPSRWRAPDLVSRIGSVFQDPDHQFVATTVRDELSLGPRLAGIAASDARSRADALLERLGLAHLAAESPFTLSGGEKRRLSVGTALASAPRALLLDEPTYGQDRATFAELVGLLREARAAGTALCVATHERALREALSGPVLALRRAA